MMMETVSDETCTVILADYNELTMLFDALNDADDLGAYLEKPCDRVLWGRRRTMLGRRVDEAAKLMPSGFTYSSIERMPFPLQDVLDIQVLAAALKNLVSLRPMARDDWREKALSFIKRIEDCELAVMVSQACNSTEWVS